MRTRVVLTGGGISAVALLATAAPASAAEGPTKAGQECIEHLEKGEDVSACQEAPNPILPVSFAMLVAMTLFETLVAFLQAFIFTILTAVYIGGAMHPEH